MTESRFQRVETGIFRRAGLRQPQGVAERMSFWLFVATLLALGLAQFEGIAGDLGVAILVVALPLLLGFLLRLGYRWLVDHLLWKVKNRLIVTCLLMGLAPVVLFATLTGIAAYVFSGQFATNSALAALQAATEDVREGSGAFAASVEHAEEENPKAASVLVPRFIRRGVAISQQAGFAVAAWRDGHPLKLDPDPSVKRSSLNLTEPLSLRALPAWVDSGFRGVVLDNHMLYMRTVSTYSINGHSVMVLASVPLTESILKALGEGLGSISVVASGRLRTDEHVIERTADGSEPATADTSPSFNLVQGGDVPLPKHFFDARVFFTTPLHIVSWERNTDVPALIGVVSRPTQLYQLLFANSLRVGTIVRDALIAISVLFLILELIAFWMAVKLSRTITRSIADLYQATTEIDHGNLAHRIRVERRDQLAALSTSFNTMAGSLGELLAQQREQERMQSELAIAQEVQNNLFPHSPIHVPNFELHGVCKPARTVSGDYYDFILAEGQELCLALGDISGKGISAALLMASLHSAVRAYRLAGEEQGQFSEKENPLQEIIQETFTSPAKLLTLLNRHLYTSTQPEKYATLFVACYNTDTRKLTYSNGGQLPPLILCKDGSTKRLDCGGSVVGLLDGMVYDEATVILDCGDVLVAYSDGVTEPENEFGEFGEDRLVDVVRKYHDQPLATISAHAMRALRSWIGEAEQPDDITLVLARQL